MCVMWPLVGRQRLCQGGKFARGFFARGGKAGGGFGFGDHHCRFQGFLRLSRWKCLGKCRCTMQMHMQMHMHMHMQMHYDALQQCTLTGSVQQTHSKSTVCLKCTKICSTTYTDSGCPKKIMYNNFIIHSESQNNRFYYFPHLQNMWHKVFLCLGEKGGWPSAWFIIINMAARWRCWINVDYNTTVWILLKLFVTKIIIL